MATITVTNTDDSGAGSLRQAIADAIAGDTIVFDASLAGQSITLTSGQLALTKDITINGDIDGDRKADITISGNDASRIFDIAGAITGTEVELRSLTLKQGNAGGGFGGAVTVAGTTILKVIDSTISDSAAVSGGGIAAFGPLTVVNSTITGNTATSTGGGVMRTGGDVTFVNSTIHDNHSDLGGGIFVAASLLTILNSTVSGNTATSGGAGFHGIASSDAVIRNSVVAENAGPNGDLSISGSVHAGSSFFGATAHTIVDHGGNIVNGGDPLLGDLADNGGPVQTRAILAGSPLIGAGNAALLPDDAFDLDGDADTSEDLPLDARGHTRVLDANLDIGATEFDTAPVLSGVTSPVTFSENTVNAAPQLLDADVTFTDNDDNFDGGALTVTGLLVEDVVSIRNQGNGLGQIGLSAGVVSFSGTDIGVATGGNGTALTVTFNTDATAAAIEALIENLTYANSSGTPTASRTLTVTVTEADGDVTRDLSQPAFAEATGAANPFDGVDVGFDSTPILADLDGDGDLDAIIGENVGNLNYFRNTGTANAPVFVQQTGAANPFDGIDVGSVSTPALADLDGDGALDMVVGEAFGTLLYFQNTGTAAAPVFVAQTGTAHPFDGIDVGFFSSPTLADLDGDGDLDAVVGSADVGPEVIGEKFGTLHYFQNTGTAAAPVFVEQTGAANPFDGMNAVDRPAPDLADLDGDGDFDAVVAEYLSGTLFYLQNIGTAAAPVFVERTGAANPFDGIDNATDRPAATLADLDGDGDLDVLLGNVNGILFTFTNTPAAGIPVTVDVTAENDTPVLTDVTTPVTFLENAVNLAPQIIDADVTFTDPDNNFDGGTLTVTGLLAEDAVSIRDQGAGAGQIGFSAGVVSFGGTDIGMATGGSGTALTVTFNADATAAAIEALIENLAYSNASDTPAATRTLTVAVTDADGDVTRGGASFAVPVGGNNLFDGVTLGGHSAPSFGDIDGDGDLDLAVGQANGLLSFFLNNGSASAPVFAQQTGIANPFDAFDVGDQSVPFLADFDRDGDIDVLIAERTGELFYLNNTGTAQAPAFTFETGANNPFDGINEGDFSKAAIGDLDNDGDLDLVIGKSDGTFAYYENIGTLATPAFAVQAGAANPFDGIDIGNFASVALVDIDGDHDLDVVSGDSGGTLNVLENTGSAGAPAFVLRTGTANPFDGLDFNTSSVAAFGDLDGDGDADGVVGNFAGELHHVLNTTPIGVPIVVEVTAENDPPVASPVDLGTIAEDSGSRLITAAELLADAVDPDGPALSVVSLTKATGGGTLTPLSPSSWEYVPAPDDDGAVTFDFTITDGEFTTSSSATLDITPVNDAPVLADLAESVTFLENTVNAAPQLLDADVTFTDPEDNFDGGALTVAGLLAEDTVSIRNQGNGAGQIGFNAGLVSFGGTAIGTVAGGAGATLTVTFNASATAAAVEALIQNLTYANASDTPAASRDLTVTVTDAAAASTDATITVNVTPGNDAPVLTDVAVSVTFAENLVNLTPQLLDADVTFTDPESNFDGGTLTVTGLLAEDAVSIRNQGHGAGQIGFAAGIVSFGGIAIGAVAGGAGATLTVTFNGAATAAAVEALIQNLTYANASDTPIASRDLTITVTDNAAASASATITVNVTDESDIGVTIIGSKNDDLVDAANTVAGQPLPTNLNDLILGNKGNDDLSGLFGVDTIDGGKGDDVLRGGGGNDILQIQGKEGKRDIFDGGPGSDTLQFLGTGKISLNGFDAAASSIEILQGNGGGVAGSGEADLFDLSALTAMTGLPVIDAKGGDDILIGSDFADELRGGSGNDILDGRGGNDVLRGGGGNDTFVFADGYGADSVADYKAGEDIFDFTGVLSVDDFGDLFLTQVDPKTVLIDFDGIAGGDTLTVQKTTIAILAANQGDFLFA